MNIDLTILYRNVKVDSHSLSPLTSLTDKKKTREKYARGNPCNDYVIVKNNRESFVIHRTWKLLSTVTRTHTHTYISTN